MFHEALITGGTIGPVPSVYAKKGEIIMTTTHCYEELKPAEMEELVSAAPIAYVPSGTLEWHSAHLPLGLDALKAHGLCTLAAEQRQVETTAPSDKGLRPVCSNSQAETSAPTI